MHLKNGKKLYNERGITFFHETERYVNNLNIYNRSKKRNELMGWPNISSFSFCFIFWLTKLIFPLLSWICYLSVNWLNFISSDCLFFRSNFLSRIFLLFQFWNKLIAFSIHALPTFYILQRIHWIFYFYILRFFFYFWVN